MDYGNTKITQQALRASIVFRMLKLDTPRKKKKKKKKKKKQRNKETKKERKKKERKKKKASSKPMLTFLFHSNVVVFVVIDGVITVRTTLPVSSTFLFQPPSGVGEPRRYLPQSQLPCTDDGIKAKHTHQRGISKIPMK